MPGMSRIAGGAVLLMLLAGITDAAAQQAGRGGAGGRSADPRAGRPASGEAARAGLSRGYAPGLDAYAGQGWLQAWSSVPPHGRLVCRPVAAPATRRGAGGATFLAECAAAPLGYFEGGFGYGYPGSVSFGHTGYAAWPGYSAWPGYGAWPPWPPPAPIVLPPEERPHRFYADFHPNAAGSGVPPLTCDPRPGAPCPPVAAGVAVAPRAGLPPTAAVLPAGVAASDCAEITARAVNGALYRGRTSLAVLGVERAEDAALAIESALARGATVALLGEHGYPLYLPPVAFLESVESGACRR